MRFQSTQPEWAATIVLHSIMMNKKISIHAARVGCDWNEWFRAEYLQDISIHAARVGCDSNDS